MSLPGLASACPRAPIYPIYPSIYCAKDNALACSVSMQGVGYIMGGDISFGLFLRHHILTAFQADGNPREANGTRNPTKVPPNQVNTPHSSSKMLSLGRGGGRGQGRRAAPPLERCASSSKINVQLESRDTDFELKARQLRKERQEMEDRLREMEACPGPPPPWVPPPQRLIGRSIVWTSVLQTWRLRWAGG